METTNNNSAKTRSFLEGEIRDAQDGIARLDSNIDNSINVGSYILIVAGILSSILAGKGLGAFGLDVLHQVALGAVVLILVMLLGKRAALSNPQISVLLVCTYSLFMVFISAAFFVLGFIGDEPVRQCFNDDLINTREITIKYGTEQQKALIFVRTIEDQGRVFHNQAMNERSTGSISGAAGENGVVYKTYTESGDFLLKEATDFRRKIDNNEKILKNISDIIANTQKSLWDESLEPKDLQRLAEKVEFELQTQFVSITQNSALAEEASGILMGYQDKINSKRSDRTNLELKQSQLDAVGEHKAELVRFADKLKGWNFIDRLENVKTIKISTPNVYIANLYQIHRYFYLWIIGIMLDVAAPLILYFIIKNFIKKRDELQETMNTYTQQLEALGPK